MSDSTIDIVLRAQDQASKAIKSVQDSINGLGEKVKTSTKSAQDFTKWVGLLAGVVGWYAVKSFMDFEKTMSAVQAVTDSTSVDMKKLNELAQSEGQRTKYSTKQVADAMFVLGQAGETANDMFKVLPQTLDLATAGGMDLAGAADIMVSSLNGMNLPLDQSQHLIDVIAKTANISAISMSDYGESMKYIAPTAAALKIPLEDVSAYIAILGNNGEKGSIATRAFGTSLANLANSSSKYSKEAESLWVHLFDTQGKFSGMKNLIEQVDNATKNMTDRDKQAAIIRMFGAESMQEMNILLATGSQKYGEISDSLKTADGAARKMADTMMNNLAGSWEQFTGNIENVAINIGWALAKYLRPALDAATAAMQNMGKEWDKLSPGMQETLKVVGTVTLALTGLVVVVGAVGIACAVATPAIAAVTATIGFFLSPVGLVIAALAALGVAYTTNFLGFKTTVDGAWTYISPYINKFINAFLAFSGKVSYSMGLIEKTINNVWWRIAPFLEKTLKNINENFWNIFDDIFSIVDGTFSIRPLSKIITST